MKNVIDGPMPCIRCRALVYWVRTATGRELRDKRTGRRHRCEVAA